jgi:hypothetical protein
MSKKGESKTDERLKTKHQNSIVDLVSIGGGKVVTAGLDGNLVFW